MPRSASEIAFRCRQELANLRLLWRPPGWDEPLEGPLPGLPAPLALGERLRGSAHAAELEHLAQQILEHRFQLLGLPAAELGPKIAWRRDFVHGHETGVDYFRRIPYLDFSRAGDHKIIWELNRHQHLVTLAQAFVVSGRREFLEEIPRQLKSWMDANPFQRGINWASALEVAFRALSWLWVLHLAGRHFDPGFRRRWMQSLYRHGLHLEHNLSVYFSPNTHLLGEAVALAALGQLCPQMPRAARWREIGTRVVLEQMERQVLADGSHFEQSSYYHLYATDFFLLHLALYPASPAWYRDKLARMAEFLDALVSREGILPLLGDEDGGRLFHPHGNRQGFAQATLATCAHLFGRPEWMRNPQAIHQQAAWWFGVYDAPPPRPYAPASRWFPDAGLAVLQSSQAHILVDAGAFGAGTAGHSHADTLELVAFRQGQEALIDPGTFTYLGDAQARERFRATAAHNTVSIDALEQATPSGPFRWTGLPEVQRVCWESSGEHDTLEACCRYRGFTHRRSLIFRKPDVLVVVDRISAAPGQGTSHVVEQRWLRAPASGFSLRTWPPAVEEPAERSSAMGSRQEAIRSVARYEGTLPATLVAVMEFGSHHQPQPVQSPAGDVEVACGTQILRFPENRCPEIGSRS